MKLAILLIVVLILSSSVYAIKELSKPTDNIKIKNPIYNTIDKKYFLDNIKPGDVTLILRLKKDKLVQDNNKFVSSSDTKTRINKLSSLNYDNTISSKEEVTSLIKFINGNILYSSNDYIVVNVSSDKVNNLLKDNNIVTINENTNRFKVFLDNSINAIKAQSYWNSGFKGSSVTVGIVDTGIDMAHPALSVTDSGSARIFESNNTYDFSNDYNDSVGHGTHIAGIIVSSDSTYKGVAPGVKKFVNAKGFSNSGSATDDSLLVAIEWAVKFANNPVQVLSNSWGASTKNSNNNCLSTGTLADGQDPFTLSVDDISSTYSIVTVFAAGNDGACGSTSLSVPGDSYNTITVGSVDDMDTSYRSDDVISSFSSRGLTLDGRKKPDVVAPGSLIKSTYNDGNFAIISGTSMAAPHVSGSAALFMDYGLTPLETKVLLINTADDFGNYGWDSDYGWGYINLETAFNKSNYTIQDSVSKDSYKFYRIINLSNNDKYTLTWYRHIIENNKLNDLDLYLYNENDGTLINSSTSSKDNVEQVISNKNYNSAILVVDAFSFYNSLLNETFGLSSYNNLTQINNIILNLSFNLPNEVNHSQNSTISFNITNFGEINLYNIKLNINLSNGLIGNNSIVINNLSSKNSEIYSYNLSYNSLGNKSLFVHLTAESYGKNFTFNNLTKYINILNNNVSITNYTPNNLNFIINETDSVDFTNVHIDLDNDSLNYSWYLDNYLVTNNDNYTYTSNYSSSGIHNITFFITDGLSISSISWNFSVNNVNRKPVAVAGSDKTITVNNSVSLSGSSSSDPDGNNITYLWKQNSGPENLSISNLNNKDITFTPNTAGVYTIQLIVNDGNIDSDASVLLLTVNNPTASTSSSSGGGGGGGGGASTTNIITPVITPTITSEEKTTKIIKKEVSKQEDIPKLEPKITSNTIIEKPITKTGLASITSRAFTGIKSSGKYFTKLSNWIISSNIKSFITIKNVFAKAFLVIGGVFHK